MSINKSTRKKLLLAGIITVLVVAVALVFRTLSEQ